MTLCVIMTGRLWGGLLLPEQLATALSLPVGLRGFVSLFPPQSISAALCVPLSISVCVYQWINKHLSLSPFSASSCPRQKERGAIPPGRATPGTSSLSLPHSPAPTPSTLPPSSQPSTTMTLLASERSLLIRNKFRSGEDPRSLGSRQLKEGRIYFSHNNGFTSQA